MSVKLFGMLAPLALGGLWMGGAFGAGFEREVDGAPGEVMSSLADLDIREQPGEPGTDPSRAGGVAPVFVLDRTARSMSWTVMSGERVATRMTAFFDPVEDGRRTRVTAQVERGDAPDQFVSPAFRSEGITMGLFAMALDTELNERIAPQGAWGPHCDELLARFEAQNMGDERLHRPSSVTEGVAATAGVAIRLASMEKKLLANGCNPDRPAGDFRPVSNMMGEGGSSGAGGAGWNSGSGDDGGGWASDAP